MTTPKIITLTTDFGVSSPYIAAMKGVILSVFPEAKIVDITHGVAPQDIVQAAAVVQDVTPFFPPGTVHVIVVDPGVGTGREILYAEVGSQCYLFPDNGVLGPLCETAVPQRIIAVRNRALWREPVSHTFHGRDIFAPVAAHLAMGLDAKLLGDETSPMVKLTVPQPTVAKSRIVGEIRTIDSFGNLITNIHHRHLAGRATDTSVCVLLGIYETYGIYRTYGDLPEGAMIALVGSNGHLEIAVVGDNAAERLGAEAGQTVTVAWEGWSEHVA